MRLVNLLRQVTPAGPRPANGTVGVLDFVQCRDPHRGPLPESGRRHLLDPPRPDAHPQALAWHSASPAVMVGVSGHWGNAASCRFPTNERKSDVTPPWLIPA